VLAASSEITPNVIAFANGVQNDAQSHEENDPVIFPAGQHSHTPCEGETLKIIAAHGIPLASP